jgi:O-antigen/teichoic acid export membrane protein
MNRTILLGYFARILGLSSGLLVLPLVLSSLSQAEFAVWMLFTATYSIVNVLDFGFMSTFSRYYNYIFAGAKSLSFDTSQPCTQSDEQISYPLLKVIYNISLRVYLFLAVFSSLLGGCFYIYYLKPFYNENLVEFGLEWLIYCAGISVSIYYLYFNALLAGIDRLDISYRATIISTLIFFLVVIIFPLGEKGLLVLCSAKFISIVYYRLHCFFELRNNIYYVNIVQSMPSLNEDVSTIYKGAMSLGIGTLGNFLTNRVSVIIVGAYLTIEELGQFSLTALAFSTLVSVSLITMNALSPQVSRKLIENDKNKLRGLMFKMLSLANVSFIFGALFVVFLAQDLLILIDSKSFFPSSYILLLFALTYFFEMNQQLSTNFLLLNNDLSFIKYVIFFGVLYVMISLFVLGFVERTILAAIICQLLSQTIFNNWYWPYKAYKKYSRIQLC